MLLAPAIKSTYFYLYNKLFYKMEKKWERIARAPHLWGDDARNLNNTAQAQNALAAAEANRQGGGEDRDLLFQAQINFNFGGNNEPVENEINPEDNVGDVPQPANAAVHGNGGANANGGGGGDGGRQRVFDLGDKSPFNFIAGALTFPAICYGAGELLRAILPSKMTTRPLSRPLTGLLQERWGRSLVGGCLFVVLKDAFFLYVKYRRAMIRPMRKIVNEKNRSVHQ